MPRAARKISSTGIYHIMIRGIDRTDIFRDEDDKDKFIEILEKVKKEMDFELYGYCLMDNHAHFIIKENEVSISLIMKKICGTYGGWHNYRHHRVGHLFQDRFKSECIESNAYFIAVLKYILTNPLKVRMVDNLKEYKWSSYQEYIKKENITDTEYFLGMLNENKKKAQKYFVEELNKDEVTVVNLTVDNIRRSDKEAEKIIAVELNELGTDNVGDLSVEKRIAFIKVLLSKGISKRQIIGITGISKSKVSGV
ncbi:MAG: transposase [Eubacteriales bacterium]